MFSSIRSLDGTVTQMFVHSTAPPTTHVPVPETVLIVCPIAVRLKVGKKSQIKGASVIHFLLPS